MCTRRDLGRKIRKGVRELLASKYSSFVTAPADAHELAWALAKLLAPAAAKPEHIPQESGLFQDSAGKPSPGREKAPREKAGRGWGICREERAQEG